MRNVSWVRVVIGVVLMLFGALWFLQGIGVLSGSGMSGVAIWAFIGAIAFVVGALVAIRPGRRA